MRETKPTAYCSALAYTKHSDRVAATPRYMMTMKYAAQRAARLIESTDHLRDTRERLHAYAELCKARIQERPLKSWGRLLPTPPDRWLIQVRSQDALGRRNYTICHEIGHALFYQGGLFPRSGRLQGSTDDVIEERICESIAAGLLMPRRLFLAAAADCQEPAWHVIDTLAEDFQASLEATVLRVADIRPWPNVTILQWRATRSDVKWLQLEAVALRRRPLEASVRFRVDETEPLSVLRAYRERTRTTDRFVDGSVLESRPMWLGGQYSIVSLFVAAKDGPKAT